ncbi:uncharacterized protein LOC132936182 isoform X2 [Metopolophium dirhodum]|uniref:uncharacterized protein LOC132936182 isoform X2 n=1 Tax=Metopolophium dirhodum TaxID=44670 RepID=UPI00299033A2|nr:uncharacterized protein LOC132936182 isoform X2 [Metopolophium dirhodum]
MQPGRLRFVGKQESDQTALNRVSLLPSILYSSSEINTIQNLGSATHLNQSNMNSPSSTVQNTVNNHSDSVQSNGEGKIKKVIAPSTNISTEEMTVTPDMPLSTSYAASSLINQREDMDIYVDSEPTGSLLVESETEPLLVEPETGIQFLFSSDETVDLTTKEDYTPKKSDTSLTNPRPKRACVIDKAEREKSGLCKLGKYIEGRDGSWKVILTNTSLPMFQCPICDTFLDSPESRITHEVEMHSLLFESIQKHVDIVSNPGNTACTQQLSIFNYLKLCITSEYKTIVVHELAKNTHLLKALNAIRLETIEHKTNDFFKCNYCPYETNLIFALWAHMNSKHLYLKCDSEKKSFFYCFLCNRTLTKRAKPLKHLDACIKKLTKLPITNNSPERFICVHCDESFDSLIELEKHTWGHAEKY